MKPLTPTCCMCTSRTAPASWRRCGDGRRPFCGGCWKGYTDWLRKTRQGRWADEYEAAGVVEPPVEDETL
jgi:hypothetical protein